MTAEEYDKGITELALVFAEVDGLIVKNFQFNHETKIIWRFYMFNSKKDLEALKKREIFKSIIENPDWSDFVIRDFRYKHNLQNLKKN